MRSLVLDNLNEPKPTYKISIEHKIWGSLTLYPDPVYRQDMTCSTVLLPAVCHQSWDGDRVPVP